ncbi:MAG: hypothetical protein ACC656_14755, partial [Candidatus Heimdallarchaeota archaeon]
MKIQDLIVNNNYQYKQVCVRQKKIITSLILLYQGKKYGCDNEIIFEFVIINNFIDKKDQDIGTEISLSVNNILNLQPTFEHTF